MIHTQSRCTPLASHFMRGVTDVEDLDIRGRRDCILFERGDQHLRSCARAVGVVPKPSRCLVKDKPIIQIGCRNPDGKCASGQGPRTEPSENGAFHLHNVTACNAPSTRMGSETTQEAKPTR